MANVGVDVGGTKILGVVIADDGDVLAERRVETPERAGAGLVGVLVSMIEDLRAATSERIGVVGLGVPALVDEGGLLRFAPNLADVEGLVIGREVGDAIGLPVDVDNDANAAAWGELTYGAARGASNAVVVTLGTGIGAGLIVDGRLYRGAHGFAAEVGHIVVMRDGPRCACGGVGHWEAIASGGALGRLARDRAAAGSAGEVLRLAGGDVEAVAGDHVAAAALAGNAEALAIVDDYADAVALGLASLVAVLDPERVVLGGGVLGMGDVLLGRVRHAFDRHLEGAAARGGVPIVAAGLGERAGAIGAAALAKYRLCS